jgi:hypothetical protein
MGPFDELSRTLDNLALRGGGAWWIQAYGVPGSGETLVIDEHLEHLLGWTAPAECWALGVAASCRITPTDPTINAAAQGRVVAAEGGGVVCLLSGRDGSFASRLHGTDTEPTAQEVPNGKLVDLLIRPFGRPTPPPPRPTSDVITVLWLAAIAERLDQCPLDPPGWDEVLALHPVCQTLDGWLPTPAETFCVLDAATAAWDWAYLRALAARGEAFQDLLSKEVAEWMDDGMFARWVLGTLPPPQRILAELRPRLASPVRRRLSEYVTHLLAARPPAE